MRHRMRALLSIAALAICLVDGIKWELVDGIKWAMPG